MRQLMTVLLAVMLATGSPGFADEIEDVIEAALEAYRDGDIAAAKEELDYAGQLLSQMKSEGLNAFLPAPLDGWTRTESDSAGAMMFGGGIAASADYQNAATGDRFSAQLMADSPIVSSMGAMFTNSAAMGAMGKIIRIQREKLVIGNGEITGMIDNRILLKFEGDNVEAMQAHIEAMDLGALADF